MRADLPALAGFYALALLVQLTGKYFTDLGVHDWYPALEKSPLTPPGVVFGLVWTALYFLMALAAWRIWRIRRTLKSRTLKWWLMQLVIGLIWSIMFFGHRDIEAGLGIIIALWVVIGVTFFLFRRIDSTAGWLLLPLWFWVSFAGYLNYYIATHN